ncbi:MAG: Nif3-like dinuclear metal center hexameric protein [Chitinophagaceae bacterium]|nr:Nif3-like dinuclear metal center hexameric protein [Chitinophagaceae bacterium]MBL0057323.1 Nif3-like dinuclear metal center hexameric protein [Chitinophagaceae bacterium]
MKINEVTSFLEGIAPLSLQESYDNAGLITGDPDWDCTGVITTLDATEDVVKEAVEKKCNLVVAHHPIVFSGLKKITGKNYVEKTVIQAIKKDIAIYAIHTNLDNVITGVNGKIADKLGLVNRRVLGHKQGSLRKLFTYVPSAQLDEVRNALFDAGGGQVGHYAECSFTSPGEGSFKGGEDSNPFVGTPGIRHYEAEQKLEIIFEAWKEKKILNALIKAHPYEEVAYDIISLENSSPSIGSGILGDLESSLDEAGFLQKLKEVFGLTLVRHTGLRGKPVKRIAVCGGAGSFLTGAAIAAGADCYVTADLKYHEFFDANDRLLLADIGHFESEQFTTDLLFELLSEKFPNFAVLKTGVKTNPVRYFL